MADYKGLLSKAINALPENNGNARRKVYEKARTALVGQLRSIEPPLPAKEITKHRLELENCIREVEEEATEALLMQVKAEEQRQKQLRLEKEKQEAELLAEKQQLEEQRKEKERQEAEAALSEDLSAHAQLPELDEDIETEDSIISEKEIDEEHSNDKLEPALEVAQSSAETKEQADLDTKEETKKHAGSDAEIMFIAPEGEPDDLKLISGIGPVLEKKLNKLGIIKFSQIASLNAQEVANIDDALHSRGRIEREEWISQAVKLTAQSEQPISDNINQPEEISIDKAPDNAEIANAKEQVTNDKENITDNLSEPEPILEEIITQESSIFIDEKESNSSGLIDNITEQNAPNKKSDLEHASIDDVIFEAKATIEDSSISKVDSETKENYYPDDFPLPDMPDEQVKSEQNKTISSDNEVESIANENEEVNLEGDPQVTIDRAIKKLDRAARGEDIGDNDDLSEENRTKSQIASSQNTISEVKSERGGGLTIFLVIFVLLLLAGGAGAFWAWKEGYVDVEALFGQQAIVEDNSTSIADNAQPVREVTSNNAEQENAPTPQNTTATPDAIAPVSEQLNQAENLSEATQAENIPEAQNNIIKNEERLVSEEQITPEETTVNDNANNDTTPIANEVVNNTTSVPIDTSAQSLLLEASADGATGAVPFSGSVNWSRAVDELGSPTIIAKANIPARNLGVELLIRRNSDASLPASHLMEVNFIASETFAGGSIEGLPGILLKNEELVQGTPLIGASARIVSNSFLFALSSAPQDIATNINMLENRKWIDLALVYGDGKRAIITLEKDSEAEKMFKEVIKAWQADTAASQ